MLRTDTQEVRKFYKLQTEKKEVRNFDKGKVKKRVIFRFSFLRWSVRESLHNQMTDFIRWQFELNTMWCQLSLFLLRIFNFSCLLCERGWHFLVAMLNPISLVQRKCKIFEWALGCTITKWNQAKINANISRHSIVLCDDCCLLKAALKALQFIRSD